VLVYRIPLNLIDPSNQEVTVRIGFSLPQMGAIAGPEAVTRIARRAEELGFDSLWVLDRLLYPVNPRAPYPVGDGSLPIQYKRVLDPVETLTFAAAKTERIAVGTSVLNLPWYNPVLLARRLATLDVLSGGRLRLGFGIGWSPDEYDAAGKSWETSGKRADNYVNALKAIWTKDPVELEGINYKVSKSFIGLKPIQKPHPPIYMAAYTPGAMKRVAREANGWFPVGVPLSAVGPMFEQLKDMAKQVGRSPQSLELVVRANLEFTSPTPKDRADFTGSLEQIARDFATTKNLGASELVCDVQFSPGIETVDDILKRMDEVRAMAKYDRA
jgi:probable F420-dependent oxidoreductase